ncbi:hypothetical protein C9374_010918 [Naegleria lovaniensis]|uniref:Uncharacterized protein n=1 Tax=Naegleria lovaniensis TaxID=51637 RepID=A0AA88GFQ3_NAELO|nr:uncharacterized protein C9374_010918 [Naegleria lovaniensis]KAG2374348.1 hypothetical protein C9374_010918 [Naegleria lovaniensis]
MSKPTPSSSLSSDHSVITIDSPQQFYHMVHHPESIPEHFQVQNLIGRVCKGRRENTEAFLQLTDDPLDKTAFMFGEDGVERILHIAEKYKRMNGCLDHSNASYSSNNENSTPNKTKACQDGKLAEEEALEILHLIGFEESYVKEKISHNVRFEMIVVERDSFLKKTGALIERADWNGVHTMVKHLFPKAFPYFDKYFDELQTTSFEEIRKRADFDFAEVRRSGTSHPLYWSTEEKFLQSMQEKKKLKNEEPSLIDVRAFLYFACGIRELFAGNGYTMTEKGEVALKEYLVENVKRELFEDCCVVLHLDI